MKKLLTNLYILIVMGCTVAFSVLIWNLTFAHIFEEMHHRKEVERLKESGKLPKEKEKAPTFEQVILESEKRVKHYLGYRVLEEQHIEGHFHHIGFDIGPDRRSYCSTCHGDMPHDSVKDIRAFLNMHSFFIACQVCHVKFEDGHKAEAYNWYDRKTGEFVDSPVMGAEPGTYGAKIIPMVLENGVLNRMDSQEQIDFATEFREKEKELSEGQKSRAKKLIHQVIGKHPYMCADCHQKEKPLLPLAQLGYPKERIDSITSTEVVGMIKNYTQFYMPKMLHPGESKKQPSR